MSDLAILCSAIILRADDLAHFIEAGELEEALSVSRDIATMSENVTRKIIKSTPSANELLADLQSLFDKFSRAIDEVKRP